MALFDIAGDYLHHHGTRLWQQPNLFCQTPSCRPLSSFGEASVMGGNAHRPVHYSIVFIMIMSVYGRFFKLYYTRQSPCLWPPLPENRAKHRQNLRRLCAVSWRAIIVLACVFSVFVLPAGVDPAPALLQWYSPMGRVDLQYVGAGGAVKMADRVVREMMGL